MDVTVERVEVVQVSYFDQDNRRDRTTQFAVIKGDQVILLDGKQMGLSVTKQRSGIAARVFRNAVFARLNKPIPEG